MKYLVFSCHDEINQMALLGTVGEDNADFDIDEEFKDNIRFVEEDVALPTFLLNGLTLEMKVRYVSINGNGVWKRDVAYYPVPGTESVHG